MMWQEEAFLIERIIQNRKLAYIVMMVPENQKVIYEFKNQKVAKYVINYIEVKRRYDFTADSTIQHVILSLLSILTTPFKQNEIIFGCTNDDKWVHGHAYIPYTNNVFFTLEALDEKRRRM